jgi:hypothetical protein
MKVTEEVIKAMFWTKVKFWAAAAVVAVIVCVGGVGAVHGLKTQSSQPQAAPVQVAAAQPVAPVVEPAKDAPPKPAPAPAPAPVADPKAAIQSVDRALEWLRTIQQADGHFDGKQQGAAEGQDVAVTSLAVLSWLGAGHTTRTGMYKENVKRAIEWLKAKPSDDIVQASLRTLALIERSGMTGEDKAVAQAALDELISKQDASGAWIDTQSAGTYAKTLAPTTWAAFTLKSGKVGGLNVSGEAWDKTLRFLEERQGEIVANDGNDLGSAMASSVGTARQFLGERRADDSARLAAIVIRKLPASTGDGFGEELIGWYHGSLLLFSRDRADAQKNWPQWSSALRDALVTQQVKTGDNKGAWEFRRASDAFKWGRIGTTALACLSLEVHYRYAVSSGRPDGVVKQKPTPTGDF